MINVTGFAHSLKGMKYVDLFAGIGGFHLAMKSFGAECVYASEWDKHAQTTYSANFGIHPEGDITQIEASEIPQHDILCAGFPCQPFSISGKRQGFEDTRGTLFFDVARIVKHHQPKLVFMENVRNFATHDQGNTLNTVRETLEQIGYKFWHQVLNASQFGLPQNRERIYMVAIRKDLQVESFAFPPPPNDRVILRDFLLHDEKTDRYVIKREDMTVDYDKVPVESLLMDYILKPVRVGTINKGGQGERIYSELGHAVTLSAQGGGPGSKTGCYLINGRVRKLAPRECARIQGFPEDFKIPVSDGQAWKQFGNSVPINVLQYIILALLEHKAIHELIVGSETPSLQLSRL
ncbi:modification methylase [Alkalihalobacillus alcalophilus ATCC 27647 = CGMCC 1.3604]|uniref:Cytosine-specific methyltransferase n=1 Tax=Alkalihalobacillus alcalophilus ATCC 27647 = CGMCC 1.3604 TaxID=1218173 RepID=A0A094WMM6_ALKAL|nr:DNA cytosine methyltransferase [Alkalihalobacillus alcalophilus]KGA99019.1 modification methylase [Alkalihalobacillus alcalophilus ATCC 27647 = CGMCC 1.3604]MED1560660.1 DNA cytosine methyltransferase [Alkalihalobacillus alcalophilus]THG89678.1 modification methylase [Alkalihalobacillus alcalophilus ATCC 27647 = CGMCC 1.3604]